MKWISTILLIYIMALLAVPCSDVYNSCTDTTKLVEASHSHSQDHDDHCTPFCQCACCSVSVIKVQFKLPDFNLPQNNYTAKKVVLKECQFISRYSGNIWEPPKFFA